MNGETSAGHLLWLVRAGRAHTRSELQRLTGLSRSTVGQRLDALLSAGYLRESGVDSSTGGRPPARLEFHEQHAVILAADLDATHARLAVLDLGLRPLAEEASPLRVADGPAAVLDRLVGRFGALLAAAGRAAGEVCGIGLGVPGPVEADTGRVVRPPIMPGWDGYPVPERLRRAFDVPVYVDNDANLWALGERVRHHPDSPALVLVKVSTGIGAGLVLGGTVFRGIDGGAGDVGHLRLPGYDDAGCPCGAYGCLAAVAGGGALARRLTAAGQPTATSREVAARVAAGDPAATRLAGEAGRLVGEVLATVVCVLNPGVLVVAGDLAGPHFLTGVREVLDERALSRATRRLTIATSQLGEAAGVIGAGALVRDSVYAPAAVDSRLTATAP